MHFKKEIPQNGTSQALPDPPTPQGAYDPGLPGGNSCKWGKQCRCWDSISSIKITGSGFNEESIIRKREREL